MFIVAYYKRYRQDFSIHSLIRYSVGRWRIRAIIFRCFQSWTLRGQERQDRDKIDSQSDRQQGSRFRLMGYAGGRTQLLEERVGGGAVITARVIGFRNTVRIVKFCKRDDIYEFGLTLISLVFD